MAESPAPSRIELPVPFPLGTVNAYLFPGEGDAPPALVDCGIGSSLSYGLLIDALRSHGIMDGADGHLDLFVTHGHVDHAGNAGRLRADFDLTLHAPLVESPFITTFRRDSPARNDAFADALRLHGMPEETVVKIRHGSDAIDKYLDDTPIDEDLPPEADIVVGGVSVQAARAPGHTPGSTVFHLPDNNLLTGDTLLEHITSNAVELLEADRGSHHEYVRSIEGLRRYAGCTALPGHRKPFELTDEVIDRHLGWHKERADAIVEALHRPRTAWGLMPIIFPSKQKITDYFLCMSDLVGHLHALEIEGRVRSSDGDVRRFQAA